MTKKELTFEEKMSELDGILKRLDDQETPIDDLAEDVKRGASLIKELESKLKQVEVEVEDAFKELDSSDLDKINPIQDSNTVINTESSQEQETQIDDNDLPF